MAAPPAANQSTPQSAATQAEQTQLLRDILAELRLLRAELQESRVKSTSD